MIEQLTLRNWKSYQDSTLYIEPLTFIIGYNAGGKSNLLDALYFLSQLAKGATVDEAAMQVRGGKEWIISRDAATCGLTLKLHEGDVDYEYTIEFAPEDDKLLLTEETLLTATRTLCDSRQLRPAHRDRIALLSLAASGAHDDTTASVRLVLDRLQSIFVLNPMPSLMRGYTPLQQVLKSDASNIAGVIAAIELKTPNRLQERIAEFVRPLPERDIVRIWTETVGLHQKDAMLYCEENWAPGRTETFDAKGMSDGTLRFLAVVTALLTLPPHTLLLIEEVDNGLHPARSKELIKALKEVGAERSIDVLCTTHNPYLIDALGNEMIPCITYVRRNPLTGKSELQTLDQHEQLVNLMAAGSIGLSMVKGQL
jgi:predicted ATPase